MLWLFAAFAPLLAAGPAPLVQGPMMIRYPQGELFGLPPVMSIVELPNGQIAVSGSQLAFFEDNRWKQVASVQKQSIRCLRADGDTLWLASFGEIGRIKLPLRTDSRYETVSPPGVLPAEELWELAIVGSNVAVATKDKFWLFDRAGNVRHQADLPNPGRIELTLLRGRLIVGNDVAGAWELVGEKLERLQNPLPDPNDRGWVWSEGDFVLTSNALYQHRSEHYERLIKWSEIVRPAIVACAARWGKEIAVGLVAQGVALFDLETKQCRFLKTEHGLQTLTPWELMVDARGRLWVGSERGIVVFESEQVGRVLKPARQIATAIRHEGLFLSYLDGADYLHDDGQVETFNEMIYKFLPTPHGIAYGTWGRVRIGDKRFSTPGSRIGASVVLPDGDLFVTAGGRTYHIEPVTAKSTLVSTAPGELVSLAVLKNELWVIGRDSNLYRSPAHPPFAFHKVAALPPNTSRLQPFGANLVFCSDLNAWFGEDLRPVANVEGQRLRIAENDDGVWVLAEQDGNARLGRLATRGGSVVWEPVAARGLSQVTEWNTFTASGHVVLVCNDHSILELNTEHLTPPAPPPPPRLAFTFRDFATGADTVLSSPPVELEADANSLAFSGTIPFDEFVERPRFERRLLPTETNWIPTKLGEVVSYPSLSSRTYTLEVRSAHLGRKGAVVAHTFTVRPPWYATRSAAAGYLALAAVSFFGLYRLRTHQLRRRTAELERIVEERTHALKEASEAKTEFLASMSHEIRNPMNGVIGLVNILREQPAASPKQEQTLRLLQHCADQLRSTVDDILDFSRIEAGKVTLDNTTFDLRDTLEAAAVTIDQSGAGITFLDRPPQGVALIGDVGKLRQILANYLSNALKYGVPPVARVSTLLTPTAGGVRLTIGVASSGPTIPKDTLDKFFDTFTRGTEAVERNIHGTGLGLAICRKYAEAMGGEVGAVSANGETTFYLNLPFARAGGATPATASSQPPAILPAKALAIEDEDYNRIVLGDILSKMNYTVDWATTGAEALKLAQENGYDIILTDYRLPDTNGVELTKKILQFCPDPKPAVFAVTAYSTKERKDECLNAGMSGFISKPITLEKLRSTLAGWGERNLAKISLEAGRMPPPPPHAAPPPTITAGWAELRATIPRDSKHAAFLAHQLNNQCRAHGLIDVAEQLELLEGALERGEPPHPFTDAIEEFLRN